MDIKDSLIALAVIVVWGVNFYFMKLALNEVSPMVLGMPAEQRANAWGVLPTVLAFLESRIARDWMKPHPGEEFDPVRFALAAVVYLVVALVKPERF